MWQRASLDFFTHCLIMFIVFCVCGLRYTFLADRTNGRAIGTVLRLSVVSIVT